MRKRNKIAALLICTALLISVTACGNDKNGSESNEPGTSQSNEAGTTGATKHLTYLTDQQSAVMDEQSALVRGVLWWEVLDMTQSSLVWFDEDGEMHPCLAEEHELSEDSLTLTMKIRDDCYWDNGDKVTPEDVAFSINRVYSEEAEGSWMKVRWVPYLDKAEVTGENEVTVHFNSPNPVLYTAMYFLWIVDESTYATTSYDEYWALPPTCGAFKINVYDPVNNAFELERNETWWGWKEDSYFVQTYGTGNVKTISIKYSPEVTTRASSVIADEIQGAENMSPETIGMIEDAGASVVSYDRASHVNLGYRMSKDDLFNDKNLREAVSLAIDRNALAESIYGGYSAACTWGCGPKCSGYKETEGYEYDPEKAAQLIAESGYNGEEVLLIADVNTLPNGMELAQSLEYMLSSIGFNVALSTPDAAVFASETAEGNYDLRMCGHVGANNDWFLDIANLTYKDWDRAGWEDTTLTSLCEAVINSGSNEQQATREAYYEYVVENFMPRVYLVDMPGLHAFSASLDTSTVILHSNSAVDYRFAVIND